MLQVINRKMNSVLSFLALGDPADRAKIEELGFADREETDKILVALDANKEELLNELDSAKKEEEASRKELLDSIHSGDLSIAVSIRLMQILAKERGFDTDSLEEIPADVAERIRDNFSSDEVAGAMKETLEGVEGMDKETILEEADLFSIDLCE